MLATWAHYLLTKEVRRLRLRLSLCAFYSDRCWRPACNNSSTQITTPQRLFWEKTLLTSPRESFISCLKSTTKNVHLIGPSVSYDTWVIHFRWKCCYNSLASLPLSLLFLVCLFVCLWDSLTLWPTEIWTWQPPKPSLTNAMVTDNHTFSFFQSCRVVCPFCPGSSWVVLLFPWML